MARVRNMNCPVLRSDPNKVPILLESDKEGKKRNIDQIINKVPVNLRKSIERRLRPLLEVVSKYGMHRASPPMGSVRGPYTPAKVEVSVSYFDNKGEYTLDKEKSISGYIHSVFLLIREGLLRFFFSPLNNKERTHHFKSPIDISLIPDPTSITNMSIEGLPDPEKGFKVLFRRGVSEQNMLSKEIVFKEVSPAQVIT
jgi:hypothetical protein